MFDYHLLSRFANTKRIKIIWCRDHRTHGVRFNNPVIKYVAKFVGATTTLVDRTGQTNTSWFDYSPIPSDVNTEKSFETCALETAEGIWNLARKKNNLPVHIGWSGGIDSSVALLALLETKPIDNELHVRYTTDSIQEFPSLYNEVVSKQWKPVPVDMLYDTDYYNRTDCLKVSGDCGDQIFGSDSVVDDDNSFHDSWQIMKKWDLEKIYAPVFSSHGKRAVWPADLKIRPELWKYIDEHVTRAPFKIKTIFDLYWWINFSLKWQHVKYRMAIQFSGATEYKANLAFFDTEDFQRWSLSNHDKKHKYSWTSYKWPAKEFIHKYHPDRDYLINKKKVGSGISSVPWRKSGSQGLRSYPDRPQLILSDGRIWKYSDGEIPAHVDEEVSIFEEFYWLRK